MTDFNAFISAATSGHIDAGDTPLPERIGRYRVERVLGQGGFGMVFLAFDEQLKRAVAVKVPHAERITGPDDAQEYLTEARTVANLDHPTIVPVYDVGSTPEFPCFIVSKYIEGADLATILKTSRLSHGDSAALIATVAEALHYAHKQGLVHRDIKPGNILIDKAGKAFVVDFGLALRENDVGGALRYAGTPAYMSPEQARGEGHRVDGRSDIFSLGVVFYQLLVGRRPFLGDTPAELLTKITTHEPRPPRQYDDGVSKELERICLKMLSKKASERYLAAKDVAEDLVHWQAVASPEESCRQVNINLAVAVDTKAVETTPPVTPGFDSQPIKIVPKGLRSFDEHDADFFLELLPGPRDRDGLPDSIRFWKSRIEETDADKTFAVGLIYGPSGCGKSSLVKAGLLPYLSKDVIPIYVDSTADETEIRMLRALRKHCPSLADNLCLKDTLAILRRGQELPEGKKVLIVLDQFEQWLHANSENENTELVQALRQCDGEHVQCIVMVRDDFWMAATRFLANLEVELLQGRNLAAVDLFDLRHARRVLTAIGRALGAIPESTTSTTAEQQQFLDKAVLDLAEEGKVVCVRLALFAEMMKGKSWTPITLKEVGGTEGVGVAFLEEVFSSQTANPNHRLHQNAARAVLKALLPEPGTDIKGNMRAYQELLEASGYLTRGQDFDTLIRILDSEIRLITPTDPEGIETANVASPIVAGQKYYQLTHDYLVPSLRDWLTRKQRETRRGRAELRLVERSALWHAKPQNRHLPSLWEYLNIRLLTNGNNWTEAQRRMMGKAGTLHGFRSGLAGLVMIAIIAASFFISGQVEDRQNRNYATALVQSLLAANTADVENLVNELSKYRQWSMPELEQIVNDKSSESKEKLHARLALVGDDPSQVDYLYDRLLTAQAEEVSVIIRFLSPYKNRLNEQLWQSVRTGTGEQRIRAAAALAEYDPQDDAWQKVNADVVTALVSVPTVEAKQWIDMLRPVGKELVAPLETRYRDRSPARDAERPSIAGALGAFCETDSQKLTELILLAGDKSEFSSLLQAIRPHRESVFMELQKLLGQPAPAVFDLSGMSPAQKRLVPKNSTPELRDAFWKKQVNAAVCLLGLGEQEDFWPLLKQTPHPSLRNFIIDRLARLGADFKTLAEHLAQETDPTIQQALILTLGEFDAGKLSDSQRQVMVEQLTTLYRTNPDPGIHSAAAWTLRQWHAEATVKRLDAELRSALFQSQRNWFVNSQEQTFAIVDGPVEFLIGDTTKKKVTLNNRFAVATHEVTVAQFQQFSKDHEHDAKYASQSDCPVNKVRWYDAVEYCNWLNGQEGIPKEQWCYEPNDNGKYDEGMTIPSDFLQRTGYRLPTMAEWEFACRANTASGYSFGEPLELLDRYAWYYSNSKNRLWPVASLKPNGLGLFDTHGNAAEWSHDLFETRIAIVKEKVGRNYCTTLNGSFLDQPQSLHSGSTRFSEKGRGTFSLGFRAARTLP